MSFWHCYFKGMGRKRFILGIWINLLCVSAFGQYNISIKATILDKNSGLPIPYVNISFKHKGLNTVTNREGMFALSYDEKEIVPGDLIEFSAFGYKKEQTAASTLYRMLQNTDKIYLTPNSASPEGNNPESTAAPWRTRGRVTHKGVPLQGASVRIGNALAETRTDADGEYSIAADREDVLIFDFIGMLPREISVDGRHILDVGLETDATITVLDGVQLLGERKEEEKMIDLGLGGKKSFDALGYDVKTMTSKEIKPHYSNLNDLLQGKFAGVEISLIPDYGKGPEVYILRQGSINYNSAAIFDVDGQIFEAFPPIDVQQIESISIIKSIAGTNKYGSRGRGGVVVIRTKATRGPESRPDVPSALAKGNDYSESLAALEEAIPVPSLLQELMEAPTYARAKDIFRSLERDQGGSIPLYLGAARYFVQWDRSFSLDILSRAEMLARDNAKALRSLAFHYEALDRTEDARSVYQRIALLRPGEAQSHRDLALAYGGTGFYREAMRLYKQMLRNEIEGVDFSGLQQPIADELRHLLAHHRDKVDFTGLPPELLAPGFKQDLRLVFEWNDPSAEFELQFVNPQKKFYTWQHTLFDKRERLLDEVKKGYATEVYIIDDAGSGEWIVNLEAVNNMEPSTNPDYLKYTLYRNYGLADETKTVRVVPLQGLEGKATLDRIISP